MSVNSSKKGIPDNSTQRYLPFSQIRENIMVMKDNSARIVLRCSTINFLLKSTEEQDAIILSYQRFLNSLDFPVQILVRSTKLDIDSYLKNLSYKAEDHTNEKLKTQTYEYIRYLERLVEFAQIMKKEFYIIIPFDNLEDTSVRDLSLVGSLKNFWASINGKDDITKLRVQMQEFEKIKKWLMGRVNAIKTSLESIWIKTQELSKEELVNLTMDYYNPSFDNIGKLRSSLDSYDLI